MGKILDNILSEADVQSYLELLKNHDIFTYKHVIKTAELIEKAFPFLDLKNDDVTKEELIRGAVLHDIGKLNVPKEILDKPAGLNAVEKKTMRKHVLLGLDFLKKESVNVRNMCLLHHERIDGSGYPYGYTEAMIPKHCRYLAIIDVIEALTANRPYREPCRTYKELEKIINEMKADRIFRADEANLIMNLVKKKELGLGLK